MRNECEIQILWVFRKLLWFTLWGKSPTRFLRHLISSGKLQLFIEIVWFKQIFSASSTNHRNSQFLAIKSDSKFTSTSISFWLLIATQLRPWVVYIPSSCVSFHNTKDCACRLSQISSWEKTSFCDSNKKLKACWCDIPVVWNASRWEWCCFSNQKVE